MTQILSFVPPEARLDLYAGDGATVRVTLKDPDGAPIPLDGEVTAQIREFRDDAAALLSFAVTVEDNQATLALTGEQTRELGDFHGAWDCQLVRNGDSPQTLAQGKCRCVLDVTRD